MDFDAAHSAFRDALYGAAVTGTNWKSTLAEYVKLVRADASIFHIYDFQTRRLDAAEWLNYPDEFVQRGKDRWFAEDEWFKVGRAKVEKHPELIRTGLIFHGAAEVPQKEFMRTAYYNEFVKEAESTDTLVCAVFHGPRYNMSVAAHVAGKHAPVFTPDQRNVASRILDDFRHALGLHVRLAAHRVRSTAMSLWEATKLPVLLVRDHRIVAANAAAAKTLAAGEIVGAVGDRLSILDQGLKDAADTLTKNAKNRQHVQAAVGRSGSRWLVQLVRFNQVSGTVLHAVGVDDPALLIVLTPLDFDAAGRAEAIQMMQGLTPVERKVAVDLANGWSVAGIAEERNLSIETVRWHVRNMIAKLGARNLADLERILALLLPL